MSTRSQKEHRHTPHSKAFDMLSHGSLEALLAGIPTMLMFRAREAVHENLQHTLHSVFTKGEKAASDALHGANSGKLKISEPMVVAALVIGAAALHGAWRGKRHHEERSFTQQEEDRRAATRASHAR